MKIRNHIASRVKKAQPLKPEIQTQFVQGDHEYITNAYFMVKMPKAPDQKEDGRNLPIMSMAEKAINVGTMDFIRFDMEYLLDALTIMKDNGAEYIDLKVGRQGMRLEGHRNARDKEENPVITSLVMAIAK